MGLLRSIQIGLTWIYLAVYRFPLYEGAKDPSIIGPYIVTNLKIYQYRWGF